ncbi:MAG: AAA family ATPase [Streptosporangiales bacterium]|nr:AAA family ATPase [Streptosporangiales bacterium]
MWHVGTPEVVLEALDPEQRAAATAVRGPVCILAGAGTGKTRAITHRIAYAVLSGAVPPGQVLAVTFTARAAGEMRSRLRELGVSGVQARTFHAAALRQLSYFWPRTVGGPPPKVIESKLSLIAEAARSSGAAQMSLGSSDLRDVASEIEWAKVTQVRPRNYPEAAARAGRKPPVPASDLATLYDAYEQLRRERHLLDFEAMLELTAAILGEHPEAAAEVRERYRYFVVDEYQDVNPIQKLLLDMWLGGRRDVCVVGDPNQTIYSFTGATSEYLLTFGKEHPDATMIRLVRDYRSTPQVVRLAGDILRWADGAAARSGVELVAQRPDGPEPLFAEHEDEAAEAADVARQVRGLIDAGVPAREIAVLFRINAQSQSYEQAFAEAGVPYMVRGAERFFDRPEVRQAMVLLRGAVRGGAEAGDLVTSVRHALSAAGLTDEPPAGSGTARERWESLSALVQLAEDLRASHPDVDLAGYVAELEARAASQHAPTLDGTTLASLHAAKGLEWDAVFLVGLVEGVLPIIYAETPEQVEEERRLLYVGATRARTRLALSWALARSEDGRQNRRPSRFVEGLWPGATRRGRRGVPGSRAGAARRPTVVPCRVCGRPLASPAEHKLGRCAGCPADVDELLLDRLREWRLEVSREQRVPAYVIFTDATLQAIAERRPADELGLLAIPGVGRVKLERYGAAVLELCGSDGSDRSDGADGSNRAAAAGGEVSDEP